VGGKAAGGIVRCQTAAEDCHGLVEDVGVAVLHGCTASMIVDNYNYVERVIGSAGHQNQNLVCTVCIRR